jgi:hypothetical protein
MPILILSGLMITTTLTKPQLTTPTLSNYDRYICVIRTPVSNPLRILALSSHNAQKLADSLCQKTQIQEKYDSIEITSRRRDFLQAKHIFNQQYDLIFNRLHVITGVAPEYALFYSVLTNGPDYSLYWLSNKSPVELSSDYFSDKHLGLLADPLSQSYYLQPMNRLKAAGVNLNDKQILLYPDLRSLYLAFRTGAVDIIPSAAEINLDFDTKPDFRTLIGEHLESGVWLVSKKVPEQLHCLLANNVSRLLTNEPGFRQKDAPCVTP